MAIDNVNPVTIPPQPAKTYPLLWLEEFRTKAGDFNHVWAYASLRPYRTEAGVDEFAPGTQPVTWMDGNIFTMHLRRPDLDAIVGQVLDIMPTIRAGAPSNTLAVLELLAQVIGAVSQAPVQEEVPLD